jgi:hypothetical protein
MAGSLTDYAEKKLLDQVFGATAWTAPATLYFGLLTDSNTATQRDAGTVTEVSTGTWTNYQRAAVTNNTTNFPNATGTLATKNNANDIGTAAFLSSGTTIAITGGPTVTINAVGIFDASTAGNMIGWFDLTVAKTVSAGDTFKLPASTGFTGTLD